MLSLVLRVSRCKECPQEKQQKQQKRQQSTFRPVFSTNFIIFTVVQSSIRGSFWYCFMQTIRSPIPRNKSECDPQRHSLICICICICIYFLYLYFHLYADHWKPRSPGTNRDVIPDDLVSIFHKQSCNFGFVTHLFGTEIKALYSEETVGFFSFQICIFCIFYILKNLTFYRKSSRNNLSKNWNTNTNLPGSPWCQLPYHSNLSFGAAQWGRASLNTYSGDKEQQTNKKAKKQQKNICKNICLGFPLPPGQPFENAGAREATFHPMYSTKWDRVVWRFWQESGENFKWIIFLCNNPWQSVIIRSSSRWCSKWDRFRCLRQSTLWQAVSLIGINCLTISHIPPFRYFPILNLPIGNYFGHPHQILPCCRMRFKNFNSIYWMLAPIKILSRNEELAFDDCKRILDYLKGSLEQQVTHHHYHLDHHHHPLYPL